MKNLKLWLILLGVIVAKLIVVALSVGAIFGVICLIGNLVNWTCADIGRFILFIGIMVYVIYRLMRKEFDK